MKIVVGNLKMNLISALERDNYLKGMENSLAGGEFKNTKIILCPPSIHLEFFKNNFLKTNIGIGAQNICGEEKGTHTGEVSAPMVKNFGGDFVIIGHSERRILFSETNIAVNKKIKIALKHNLTPIVCIGESEQARQAGEIKRVLLEQLVDGLNGLNKNKVAQVIIAYEPVWSIGSGKTPNSDEIMEVRILIQKILIDNFGLKIDKLPKIIYGGSVNYRNIQEVCLDPKMDGVLVGGESLHPTDFIKIGKILENN